MGATTVKLIISIGQHRTGCDVHLTRLNALLVEKGQVRTNIKAAIAAMDAVARAAHGVAGGASGSQQNLGNKGTAVETQVTNDPAYKKAEAELDKANARFNAIFKEADGVIAALRTPLTSLKAENQKLREHVAKKKSIWNALKGKKSVPEAEACVAAAAAYIGDCDLLIKAMS